MGVLEWDPGFGDVPGRCMGVSHGTGSGYGMEIDKQCHFFLAPAAQTNHACSRKVSSHGGEGRWCNKILVPPRT